MQVYVRCGATMPIIAQSLRLCYDQPEMAPQGGIAHAHGRVFSTEYEDKAIKAEVEIEEPYVERFREFVITEQ